MTEDEVLDAIDRATENALAEIRALRAALAGREADVEQLRSICEERQLVIDTLQAASDERLALVERLSQEIERLAVESEAARAAHDGIDWQSIAIEREELLERVSMEAERRSVLLADLTAALQARTDEVEQLRRERASVS